MTVRFAARCEGCGLGFELAVEQFSRSGEAQWRCPGCGRPCSARAPVAAARRHYAQTEDPLPGELTAEEIEQSRQARIARFNDQLN